MIDLVAGKEDHKDWKIQEESMASWTAHNGSLLSQVSEGDQLRAN